MDKFYDWDDKYTNAVITIVSIAISFATYWFIILSEKIKSRFFVKYQAENAWVRYVFFQKMMGVLFMGVLPGTLLLSISDYNLQKLGLSLGDIKTSLICIAVMGSLIVFINYFVSKNSTNLAMYPQMRIKTWNNKRIIINSLSWAAYLFAYEFMYRGMLLIVCYDSFGFWPAVAINLSFYSATHIAKGLGETVGTFPYGLLLCFITIASGSIAVAFVTHLVLALSNDYYSIYHNPEMKFA